MAIEFMPTTVSGNAQRFQPATSMTPKNAANIQNVQPALNTAHDGGFRAPGDYLLTLAQKQQ